MKIMVVWGDGAMGAAFARVDAISKIAEKRRCRVEDFLRYRAEDAAAEAARGLVTSCESDAQGGEELGAEINLISASDSLPLKNPPLLKKSTVRADSVLNHY